jgi:hypothetical protein
VDGADAKSISCALLVLVGNTLDCVVAGAE